MSAASHKLPDGYRDRIRRLRADAALTQQRLAECLPVSDRGSSTAARSSADSSDGRAAPNLPDARKEERTTALGVSVVLTRKSGRTLPRVTVREAIDGAVRARILKKSEGSGPWPGDFGEAQVARFDVPQANGQDWHDGPANERA